MLKNQKNKSGFDMPNYQLESLARILLPIMREYLSSKQGQKDYVEWCKQRQAHQNIGGRPLYQKEK